MSEENQAQLAEPVGETIQETPVDTADEGYSAFVHTYLYGPSDRAVHSKPDEEGKRQGKVYAFAGVYCMFNGVADSDDTLYFLLPVEKQEEGKGGLWVRQDTLIQGHDFWTVLPRFDNKPVGNKVDIQLGEQIDQ